MVRYPTWRHCPGSLWISLGNFGSGPIFSAASRLAIWRIPPDAVPSPRENQNMAPAETADARVNSDLRTGRVLCPAYYDALGQRPQPIDRVIIAPDLEPRAATARLSSSSGSAFSFAPLSPQQRRDRLALVVADVARVKRFDVTVGGLSRSQLMSKLCSRDVRLNTHAETLLGGIDFTQRALLRSLSGP